MNQAESRELLNNNNNNKDIVQIRTNKKRIFNFILYANVTCKLNPKKYTIRLTLEKIKK